MDINHIAQKMAANGLMLRSAQLTMIEQAYQALSKQKIICLEAPTGTGKTLSYGIAAYLAKSPQQIVIISTASVALQEQLMQKDLPLLGRVLGVEIKAALAKGRRRYICHARLYDEDYQTDFFSKEDYGQRLRTLLEAERWNGDRDQLDFTISDAQWTDFSTDSAGCSGKLCAYFSQCAFYKAKQKWQDSDFVITNHHLLLADLALGGGALLPEREKSLYIIDECHHFPDKALDYFSHSSPLLPSLEWINPLLIAAVKQKPLQLFLQELIDELHALQEFLQTHSHRFSESANQEKIWRCDEKEALSFDWPARIHQASLKVYTACGQWLQELEEQLKLTVQTPDQQQPLSKLIAKIGFYYLRAENFYQTLQLFCQRRQENESPLARWFLKNFQNEYYCHVAPINVSQTLKNLFWDNLNSGALLCSATLRAMGDFSDFRRRSGLNHHPHLIELALQSNFNYQSSLLFVPKMVSAPQGVEQSAHLEEVCQLLPELFLPKTGTLVLFTSRFAMEQTFKKMAPDLQADILMQGKWGKVQLFQEHRRRIEARSRSIIFGLASFGEGIDLPAELCQHVIIHKLPFAVPTTPVEQTRHEWLTQNQRDPFELSTLPNASIRLAQYVGRLIRQETDRGIISVLDKRIYTKSYGRRLLKNLPAFSHLVDCTILDFKKNPLAASFFDVE